ncbi:MAG: type II secretion system protein [Candidatus Cloacimonetes bacterium]|nr:type II secretion system protein [Candidatus Cloacimonadota bacterium]
MIMLRKKAFTIIELLVVITLVGIMATWATWSLRSTTNYYKQKQAAQIISAAIRSAKSSALKAEVDEGNSVYFNSDYATSTRNAFAIYIYRGRVDPEDVTHTISHNDATDNHEAGYSILIVNDSGLDTPDRVRSPLQINSSYTSLKDLADLETRQKIINLPEGVVIKYPGNDEDSPGADPATSILDDLTFFSYDRLGNLNTRLGDTDGFDGLNNITATGLSDKESYLVVMVGAAGSDEANADYDPIYIDLRNGNLITIEAESEFSTIDWPVFTNNP